MLPIGHTERIYSASYSPNGNFIITASFDRTAKILRALDGVLIGELKHEAPVKFACYSPDGNFILTRCDTLLTIWRFPDLLKIGELSFKAGLYSAFYSPGNNYIITASANKYPVQLWDPVTMKLIKELKEYSGLIYFAKLSPDGMHIITGSDSTLRISKLSDPTSSIDLNAEFKPYYYNGATLSSDGQRIITSASGNYKVWRCSDGKLLFELKGYKSFISSAEFAPDDKTIITTSSDSIVTILDAENGNLLKKIKQRSGIGSIKFSPDGNFLIAVSNQIVRVFEAKTYKPVFNWKGHTKKLTGIKTSPDGQYIFSFSGNAQFWDAENGALLASLGDNEINSFYSADLSPDWRYLSAACKDNSVKVWQVPDGTLVYTLLGHTDAVNSVRFSNDGKYIITSSIDSTAKVWDVFKGTLVFNLTGQNGWIDFAQFSPDRKYAVTGSWNNNNLVVWNINEGKRLYEIKGYAGAQFSPRGELLVAFSPEKPATIYRVSDGTPLLELQGRNSMISNASFSPDEKYILSPSSCVSCVVPVDTVLSDDGKLKTFRAGIEMGEKYGNVSTIWSLIDGKPVMELKGHNAMVNSALHSPDGKKIITASFDGTVRLWDALDGTLLSAIKEKLSAIPAAIFTANGKYIVTGSYDNTVKKWDALTGNVLYSFFAVDNMDYIIIDNNNRYDGTEAARKLLYFTCGTEAVELDQIKDQLWVPNLAKRIMKGDSINAKTLDELNICGLTPEVENTSSKADEYHFKILPRRGGLGQTALYINGIEVKRYNPVQLKNKAGNYELIIKKQELSTYFIAGQENPVTVKAWTADNAISSRGLTIREDKANETATTPNLYAVIVGVSDYKGEELDLKYAAKDANDISHALAIASRKLLNTDGKEHVFMYNLTTNDNRYLLPEKNSIKKTLADIGKKATANDILLIFFAGHGVMRGDENKKKFYFLSADASQSSSISAVTDVGISTTELTEWMKPANIKAQKRIMIFDACNSGQAIRDFVQLGKPEQGYVAARSDENGQQIKAIEKLNNQSGLFILAASASNKNAYEMGRYSQGLLTYSLLKAIKEQPGILENGKYLDVSNWLNAAKKTVSSLAGENFARQEPQLNANNNFIIGLVDEEVRGKIVLEAEKPLFARSNFQNSNTKIDDLKLRSAIDKEMISISIRGGGAPITYSGDYEGDNAYTLTGDYKVNGNEISVTILLVKGGTEKKYQYEIKGNVSDMNSLAMSVTSAAIDWVKNNK